MKLKKIYASKIYLTSNRKDRIRAAIQDPFNAELVQQLSDYLDDDAQEKLNDIVEEKNEAKAEESDSENPQPSADAKGPDKMRDLPDDKNVFSPSYHGGGGSGPSMDSDGGPDIFDVPEGGEAPEGGESAPSEPEAPVEESTAIYGKVTAETDIEAKINAISEDAEVIKGTLNSREDTAGVQRIAIDEKELWIYYKDEVNIGDIMVDVIEVLNGTIYTYLSFSRLARSNNAIVFDINSVEEPVKPVQEIEKENK